MSYHTSSWTAKKRLADGSEYEYRVDYRHDGTYAVRLDNGLEQRMYVKDSQRTRCYYVEDRMRADYGDVMLAKLTLDEAQALADRVCADYGVEGVTVTMKPKASSCSSYYRWLKTIKLAPTWGLRTCTVLHETAHHIAYELAATDMPISIVGHGPEFVTVLFDIYEHYLGIEVDRYRKVRRGTKGLVFADQWTNRARPGKPVDATEESLIKQVAAARVALAEVEAELEAYRKAK